MDITHFYKWKYLFWLYRITYHSCIIPKTLSLEDSESTALFAAIWHFAVLTKRALHQIAAHSMEEQNNLYLYSTTWITTAQLHQAQMTPFKTLLQKKRKIFPQPHWMMMFGLKIHFQIDICVFMNSHSQISSVLIHVHTTWTCYPPLQ